MSVALLIAAAVSPAPVVADDRVPTVRERASIERTLRAAGFTRWDEIEMDDDDGLWEVEDAYLRSGVKYDLKVHPRNYRIVERDLDDE